MTIQDFTDDYIETYGGSMILLAQVDGGNVWTKLTHYYNNLANKHFAILASGMECLLIKHKTLFMPYVTGDNKKWLMDQKTWSNLDITMVKKCQEEIYNKVRELYVC